MSTKMHALKERTYTNVKGDRLAQKGDSPRMLLGAAGHLISVEQAEALGLLDEPKKKEGGKGAEDKGNEPGDDKSEKKGGKGKKD